MGLIALAWLVTATWAMAQPYEVVTRPNIHYVEHDGIKLTGDLYPPKGRDKAPVLVAVHGGGWQVGTAPSTGIGARIWPRTATLCSRSITGCRSRAPRAIPRRSTT